MKKEVVLKKRGQKERIEIREKIEKDTELEVLIDHQKPNTISETNIYLVLEKAKVRVKAKIKVRPPASNSKALLHIRALLLDENSHILSLPQLEIENKNVVCTHSTTISTIKPQELFYMRTRGLSTQKAKEVFISSFLKAPAYGKKL